MLHYRISCMTNYLTEVKIDFEKQAASGKSIDINLQDQLPGTYILHASIDEKIFYQKIFLQ